LVVYANYRPAQAGGHSLFIVAQAVKLDAGAHRVLPLNSFDLFA
jgi:hypothetical protein